MNRISRSIPIFLLFLCGAVVTHAQKTPANWAPIAWTDYRVSSQKVSVQLPKMPTKLGLGDSCAELDGATYYAYADGVAYEFAWNAKSSQPIPRDCDTKEKFSKKTFSRRVEALKKQFWKYQESDGVVAGLPAKVFRSTYPKGTTNARWLIWDNDRWFELGMAYRTGTVIDETRFTSGLNSKNTGGQEIGDGFDVVLGDPESVHTSYPSGESDGLTIISKPKARFTDAPRQANFVGTVMLRMAFQKNGAIGDITVVKEAPYGVTNEAVKAAKRMGFLPAVVNGTP